MVWYIFAVEEILSTKEEPEKRNSELGRSKSSALWGRIKLGGVAERTGGGSVDVEVGGPVTRQRGWEAGEDEAQEADLVPFNHRFA